MRHKRLDGNKTPSMLVRLDARPVPLLYFNQVMNISTANASLPLVLTMAMRIIGSNARAETEA